MLKKTQFDVIVVGAAPAGSVAALNLVQERVERILNEYSVGRTGCHALKSFILK